MGLNNTVEVDHAALDAEADRILADVPPEPVDVTAAPSDELVAAEPSLEQIQQAAAGYEPAAFMLISKAADIVVPAWELTADERKSLSGSVALAVAAWFPDQQLPPKYMALLMLTGSVYSVVEARRDPDTGKLKPRRHDVSNQASAAADGATIPIHNGKSNGAGFSTASG